MGLCSNERLRDILSKQKEMTFELVKMSKEHLVQFKGNGTFCPCSQRTETFGFAKEYGAFGPVKGYGAFGPAKEYGAFGAAKERGHFIQLKVRGHFIHAVEGQEHLV
jgi:hypothetical protein